MVSAGLNSAGFAAQKAYRIGLNYLDKTLCEINRALEKYSFCHDAPFSKLQAYAGDVISTEYVIGDGWLTVGEAVDHIKNGYDRVLAVHPFGCLVSHVGIRGTLKRLNQLYPTASVHSVEYDYEQSDVLRESRLLLAIQ